MVTHILPGGLRLPQPFTTCRGSTPSHRNRGPRTRPALHDEGSERAAPFCATADHCAFDATPRSCAARLEAGLQPASASEPPWCRRSYQAGTKALHGAAGADTELPAAIRAVVGQRVVGAGFRDRKRDSDPGWPRRWSREFRVSRGSPGFTAGVPGLEPRTTESVPVHALLRDHRGDPRSSAGVNGVSLQTAPVGT